MKHLLLYFSFFISSLSIGFAQQPGQADQKDNKIKALYVAYITQQLQLTEGEAQKFWPVHASYENEIRATNNQADVLERQQSELNIKKKYQDKFVAIIGSGRTNTFYIKDAEFRKRMLERLKKLKQEKRGNK